MCFNISLAAYSVFTWKVHSFVNNFLAGGKIDTSLKILHINTSSDWQRQRGRAQTGVGEERSKGSPLLAHFVKRQSGKLCQSKLYEATAYADNACTTQGDVVSIGARFSYKNLLLIRRKCDASDTLESDNLQLQDMLLLQDMLQSVSVCLTLAQV